MEEHCGKMGGFVQKSRVTFIARQPPLDAMNGLFDRELLPLVSAAGRGEGSRADDAFQKIVERYVNLVHVSALRQVRDFALAEDVTQAVFIVLWNKSATVRDAAALPAWLLSVTHWVARDAIKRRTIRHRHEQQAAALNGTNAMNTDASVDFNVLAANLDGALNRLPPADRSIVAMRYLSGRSFKEVSESMGISEEAARKRSSRALERLRDLLSKHGVHSAADLLENSLAQLALLPAAVSTGALTEKIVAACHGSAGASATAAALSKTAQLVITMSKIKTAAVVATALVLALAGTSAVVSFKMAAKSDTLAVPTQKVPLNANGEPMSPAKAAQMTAWKNASAKNLKQIGLALELYANDNRGKYPDNFGTLLLLVSLPPNSFVSRGSHDTPATGPTRRVMAANLTAGGHCSYSYLAGKLTEDLPPNAVLAYEDPTIWPDGAYVLYADGSVAFEKPEIVRQIADRAAAGDAVISRPTSP
jgi:RNA polymerase sigma factor (sigma-70 family)